MSESGSAGQHRPVMVEECLHYLQARPGQVLVDGTVGQGGHLRALAAAVQPGGRVVGLDLDADALAATARWLGEAMQTVRLVQESFARLDRVLAEHAPTGVDGILLDLGVSRDQLVSERFSFSGEGELDFRLDPRAGETAAQLLARLSEPELANLLFELGDERYSRRIARAVVEARDREPLSTNAQLSELVRRAYPPAARHGRIHVATRTFQALRLAVNGLLPALQTALSVLPGQLRAGGRLAILTYHSGEDRLVKQAFRALSQHAPADGAAYRLVTPKPIAPREAEKASNPSARSALLRVLEAAVVGHGDSPCPTPN